MKNEKEDRNRKLRWKLTWSENLIKGGGERNFLWNFWIWSEFENEKVKKGCVALSTATCWDSLMYVGLDSR
jgi:hypothetical protein